MKHRYLDCLVVMYDHVGRNAFTLAGVRPALDREWLYVNGSAMETLCQARLLNRLHKKDLRVSGNHYIHQYKITPYGQVTVQRWRNNGFPLTAQC